MRILGVDPGLQTTGFGVIDCNGTQLSYVGSGTIRTTHLAPIEYRVTPRLPLPVDELRCEVAVEPPALVKGYLRMGAKVLGAPAWDPDFNTADLPLLMRVHELPPRYRRLFDLPQG